MKDVDRLPENTRRALKKILTQIRNVQNLHEVANCSRLKGIKDYYRIRIGDFRITFTCDGSTAIMRRALSRGEIYKK